MSGVFAVLAMMQLAFSSAPPTTRQDSTPASMVDLSSAAHWQPQAGWLNDPSAEHTVTPGEGLRFSAKTPGRGMKWSHALAQPISTLDRPFLTVRYRARDIARSSDYSLYLIGQSENNKRPTEFTAIPLSAVIDDEVWHQLSVEVPTMQITIVAVQVQAASVDACMEIASIHISADQPTVSLTECLAFQGGWLADNQYRTVEVHPNHPAKPWLASIGVDAGSLDQPRITVEGIPFHLHSPELQVLATSLEEREETAIDLGCSAEAVYLLMGARFTGQESPSIGAGPLIQVRQVERFVVRLEYADGTNDLIFPMRFPGGHNVVVQEPAVYVVQPTLPGVIKRLHLVDGMRQGQFVLMALTVGPRPPLQASTASTSVSPPLMRPSGLPSDAVTTETAALVVSDQHQATALVNRASESAWLAEPSPLYSVEPSDGVEAILNCRPLPTGEVELTLELVNTRQSPVTVKSTFPQITGLSPGGDPKDLMYCFPRRGCTISASEVDLREPYSGKFPLQFVDVYHPKVGGWYMMIHDMTNTPKTYWLKKKMKVDLGVDYWPTTLEPNQRWVLPPAVLGAHRGDWHEALVAYRRWLSNWYRPKVERKQWFREVFNFRQHFLHLAMPKPSGMFDKATNKLDLLTTLKADMEKFGGIDYLHLFDWDLTPTHGRGDYNPWAHLGGLDQFVSQIRRVQDLGIPVGLYIEGYLVNPKSEVFKAHAQRWQMLKADGAPLTFFPPHRNMCPHVPEWRDYLTETYRRVARESGANGYYIDQFGNASIYLCHNPNHGHPVPTSPLQDEMAVTQKVRQAIPQETVLYTEDTPTDVTAQYQDGSFTYAIACTVECLSPVPLNMARFALPDFKTFEIIACDAPLRDDEQAVKRVFFNGEGIWLEGIADDWFASETRSLIARTHRILRRHRLAFTSLDVIPLVPTRHPDVRANRFSAANEVVWTVHNAAYKSIRGELLTVEHLPGATYHDAWNDRALAPRINGNEAIVSLELGPKDVGCVIQRRPGYTLEEP